MAKATGVEIIVQRMANVSNLGNQPPATTTDGLLKQIVELLQALLINESPVEMVPDDSVSSYTTSTSPNTPKELVPQSTKVLAFILQNNGTDTITIGTQQTVKTGGIAIASGSLPLFFFPQNGDIIDMYKLFTISPSKSQGYTILAFV